MFKCHKFWYKFKDGYSHAAMLMVVLALVLYLTMALPYNLYSLNVIDRHYLGWFDKRATMLAKTTDQAEMYRTHGIDFHEPEERERQRREAQFLIDQGIDPWKEQYEKFHLGALARRYLSNHDTSGTNTAAKPDSGDAVDIDKATKDVKKKVEEDVLAVKTATFDAKFPAPFLSKD